MREEAAGYHNQAVWREELGSEAPPPYFGNVDEEFRVGLTEGRAREVAAEWDQDGVVPSYAGRSDVVVSRQEGGEMEGGWVEEEGRGRREILPEYPPPVYSECRKPWSGEET